MKNISNKYIHNKISQSDSLLKIYISKCWNRVWCQFQALCTRM